MRDLLPASCLACIVRDRIVCIVSYRIVSSSCIVSCRVARVVSCRVLRAVTCDLCRTPAPVLSCSCSRLRAACWYLCRSLLLSCSRVTAGCSCSLRLCPVAVTVGCDLCTCSRACAIRMRICAIRACSCTIRDPSRTIRARVRAIRVRVLDACACDLRLRPATACCRAYHKS
jgi:hypothetical protein